MLRLTVSGATPLLPLHAFTAYTGKNVASYLLLIMASMFREGWKSNSSGEVTVLETVVTRNS